MSALRTRIRSSRRALALRIFGAVPSGGLKASGYCRLVRRFLLFAAALFALAVWLRCGSIPPGLLSDEPGRSTVVVDRRGVTLSEIRSDLGTRGERLDASALPPALVNATLAAEDARFRSHIGVDPLAVARAAWRNLWAARITQGGSTITQQVAKLLLARQAGRPRPRGWSQKWREAVLALRLEHRLTKDEILALYLNLAPYGNQIEGAERAARAYFGRSAASLTPAEAAFLSALPQQPTRYNPWRDATAARRRQARILAAMRERGWLSSEAYATARAERLSLNRENRTALAPHFVERVLDATRDADTTPLRIETTLDSDLQRTVRGIIDAHRPLLEQHRAANVAVVVLDNTTAEWLAWEGSGDYFDTKHGGAIDGALAPRQPGSALKPFTYATAFERDLHPGQVLADVPSQFPTAVPGVWYTPRNYDGRFRGPLLARAALAGSENVPAVAVASDVGVPALLRLLRRSGFTTLDKTASHYGLGLTLGNAEVRLSDLVAAYAMFARGGEYVTPRAVRSIDGRLEPAAAAERVVSARTAFWVTDILADADARAYIFGRGGQLEFPFPVAAKTGTSQAFHDNFAVGYTREVTVGVWVGNFDRKPLVNSSGVTGAGPIFHQVMLAAVARARGGLPVGDAAAIVPPPGDVHRAEICAVSGEVAGAYCLRRVTEWVPAEAALHECTWHHASDEGWLTAWPTVFRQWARTEGLDLGGRLCTNCIVDPRGRSTSVRAMAAAPVADATQPEGPARLTIVAPLAGAVYLLDSTLRAEFQSLPLRARGASGSLEWFVDGSSVGAANAEDAVRWPLARGAHAIEVRDASGRIAKTAITVR
jgi:penicillin-binding protein 1C